MNEPKKWGNDAPHKEAASLAVRDFAKLLGIGILAVVISLCALIGIQSGIFPTSDYNSGSIYEPSRFMLEVSADGETIYEGVDATRNGLLIISRELKEDLLSTTYESPEAAMEALKPVSGNVAYAHAVNICTHSDGKVSNETGGGRHITKFRFHENNRHYTRTDHQVLTQNGYMTYDSFFYDVSRSYCGCG